MQLAAILAKGVVFKFTPSGTCTVLHHFGTLFGDAGFCQVALTQATDNYRHFCQLSSCRASIPARPHLTLSMAAKPDEQDCSSYTI